MTYYELTVHYKDDTFKDTGATSFSDDVSEAIAKVMYYEDCEKVFVVTCTNEEKYE